MAGFGTFLKNYAKGGFSPFALLSAISGKSANLLGAAESYWNKTTGAGLTGAALEANDFNAAQAQKQMDFQQQMRDTQYQSAVNDMRAAGVNPALMYGSGASGNVAPAGAAATSVVPDSGADFVGLLGQIANLSKLHSEKENIDADTKEKIANAKRAESETTLNQLKADYQSLLNEWYPKLSQYTINQMQSAVSEAYSNVTLNGYRADNMQADTALKKTQEFVQSLEAEWIPKIRAAQTSAAKASAAQGFAEAAYKQYFEQFAKEHDGVLPGPNQTLGIGAAVAGVLSDLGVGEVDLGDLDWKDMLWPWYSPFRKKNQPKK